MDGRRNMKASIKDPHFPNFSKKFSSSSSALLHKDAHQRECSVSTASRLVTEQCGGSALTGGRTKPNVTSDGQENHCPHKFLSPRQHLALDPTQDLQAITTKEKGHAEGFAGGKSMLSENALSQSALEIKNPEGSRAKGRAATSFSLSDVSMLCPDLPDLHSTAILQDAEISHLIDDVTLTNENEPGSSISALIGQFEETNHQANLGEVSPLHSTSMMSGHVPMSPALGLQTAFKQGCSQGKPKASFLCSSPELIKPSSSQTTKPPNYPVVCGMMGSSISQMKPDDDPSRNAKTRAMEDNLPGSPNSSHGWFPKGPTYGEDQGRMMNGPAVYTELVLADPTLCVNSEESSLVEIDGESENQSQTTCDYGGEDTSQLASPLKLKYNQEMAEHIQRRLRNGYCKETLCPSAPEIFSNIPGVKNQSISCPTYQGAGFVHNHFSSPDAKTNQNCGPQQSSTPDMHASVPTQSTHAPLPALKLPSPCKSKSLGDLTSEDIACNFESKYQCISKSFVMNAIRDKKGVPIKTKSLEPLDALTEQLRKLVSFDQEDSCQVLYSKQDASQLPRALVRKLSSRSQSRVRNIASRAKEKQEASKQKVATHSTGRVVLRSKPSAPAPAVNRHSTGSYIAGYLRNMEAGGLEGRGIPEGACTALRYGHVDQFCSDNSVLQTEPSSDDKPEIYFLLRL